MKISSWIRCLALSVLVVSPVAAADETITIFEAKKIITMEPSFPSAQFVAVRDGRILGVGETLDDLKAWGADYVLDRQFSEHVLMPGFVEPHLHVAFSFLFPMTFITPEGWSLPNGDSAPSQSPDDYKARLVAALDANSDEDAPFFTWGYHHLWHGEINRSALNEIAPDRPVVVWHRSFHELFFNDRALDYFGLDEETVAANAVAAGAENSHVDLANGHFFETGLGAVLPAIQNFISSDAYLGRGIGLLKEMMLQNGVTTAADLVTGAVAGLDAERLLIEQTFTKDVPARIMLVPDANSLLRRGASYDEAVAIVTDNAFTGIDRKVFTNNRVKLFADGAFFSQLMQIGPPGYTDGHHGEWITEPEEFERQARAFWQGGATIHWHVNGDAGLDALLETVAKLQAETPRFDHRLTLEHFGYARPDQVSRLRELGIQVSAQPNYVHVLGERYGEAGLGVDRASNLVRLGSLERNNVRVALHSDVPMAPVDPLRLAWIASTRTTLNGNVIGEAERLSLDGALRAITIDAAYILGLEKEIGSITAGKKADFAVLVDDPYRKKAKGLDDIEVWGVVFEGRPHQAPNE